MPKKTEAANACLTPTKPRHVIGFLVKSLQHTLRQSLDEALRKQSVELSFAHVAALFTLHHEPGITGARLARRLFVSAQTMNSVLRRLELDGRIERRPHPDSRRADSWSLKPAGIAELARAQRVGTTIFDAMLAPLNANEIAAFEDYLRRCIAALEDSSTGNDAATSGARSSARAARRNLDLGV
jgi:DNA-binding MarR family transcriptional regulator